jgi:hypothetical protein
MKTPWPMTKPTDAARRSQGGIEEMDGDELTAICIRYLLLAFLSARFQNGLTAVHSAPKMQTVLKL